MTALAHSLLRIWSAKSRVPRLTGRGHSDFIELLRDGILELVHAARRTAPTVVLIALRIFQ